MPFLSDLTRFSRAALYRHEPGGSRRAQVKVSLGAMAGMSLVGLIAIRTGLPLLLAPLGGTAVLVFGQPSSDLAQPANVAGGYLIAGTIGALAAAVLPAQWWVHTISIGVIILAMLTLRVTHPPAGALPLIALGGTLSPLTLVEGVFGGAICLLLVAMLVHRLPPRAAYPKPPRLHRQSAAAINAPAAGYRALDRGQPEHRVLPPS